MIGNRKIIGLFAGLLLATAELRAQRLSLREAVDAALVAEPAVAAARADLASARASVGESKSAVKPHLDVSSSLVEYQKPMVVTPIHGFTPGQLPEFDRTLLQSTVGATYLLFDAGASRARIDQARAGEFAAAASVDAAAASVASRTAMLYLTVLSDAASLEAHDLRTTALKSELSRVQKLFEVGRAANVEVLRVEAALASAAAERTTTAANLEVAERELARVTALPAERTRAANLEPGDLDTSTLGSREDLDRMAIDSNPALRQARERFQAQQAAISYARAGNLPRLQAAGNILQFGSAAGNFTAEWNTGVMLRWSAFDGGATRARVAQATAEAKKAEEQLRAAEKQIRDSIDQALADFDQARASEQSLRDAVTSFQEVARIEKLRLEEGAGTQTDYLRAEADLMQARAGLAAARYRSMMVFVEIARLTGQLDTAWIAQKLRSE